MRIEAKYEGRPWGSVDPLEYALMVAKGEEHFRALAQFSLDDVYATDPHWQAVLAIKREILAAKDHSEHPAYDNFARRCKAIYDERRRLQASGDTVHSEA